MQKPSCLCHVRLLGFTTSSFSSSMSGSDNISRLTPAAPHSSNHLQAFATADSAAPRANSRGSSGSSQASTAISTVTPAVRRTARPQTRRQFRFVGINKRKYVFKSKVDDGSGSNPEYDITCAGPKDLPSLGLNPGSWFDNGDQSISTDEGFWNRLNVAHQRVVEMNRVAEELASNLPQLAEAGDRNMDALPDISLDQLAHFANCASFGEFALKANAIIEESMRGGTSGALQCLIVCTPLFKPVFELLFGRLHSDLNEIMQKMEICAMLADGKVWPRTPDRAHEEKLKQESERRANPEYDDSLCTLVWSYFDVDTSKLKDDKPAFEAELARKSTLLTLAACRSALMHNSKILDEQPRLKYLYFATARCLHKASTPSPPDLPAHLQSTDLRNLGLGDKRLQDLAAAFPTEDVFRNATVDELKAVHGIGKILAERIHDFLAGKPVPESLWRGRQHAVLWNTRIRQKVWGTCAPLEAHAEAYLKEHPHYERYNGQDLLQRSPFNVPADDCMTSAQYTQCCLRAESSNALLDNLDSNAATFQLSRVSSVLHSSAADQTDLLVVLSYIAGTRLGLPVYAAREQLLQRLQQEATAEGDRNGLNEEPIRAENVHAVLGLAHKVFQRAIIILTSDTGECAYIFNDLGIDTLRVPPIHLGQVGAHFWFLKEQSELGASSSCDMFVPDQATSIMPYTETEDVVDLSHALVPKLEDTTRIMNECSEWGHRRLGVAIDLTASQQPVADLCSRIKSVDGLDAALVGGNGIGKTTFVHHVLNLTAVDSETYVEDLKDPSYSPEALSELFAGKTDHPPSLEQLKAGAKVNGVRIELLDGNPQMREQAVKEYEGQIEHLKGYVKGRTTGSPLKNFVLPSARQGTSTSRKRMRLRRGGLMHIAVKIRNEEELQHLGFSFVLLRRELGPRGVMDLERAEQREFMWAWRVYTQITSGKWREADMPTISSPLPDNNDLPSQASEVAVCHELLELAREAVHIYLGEGQSLHGDRKLIQEKIKMFNAQQGLHSVAVKSIEVFMPCMVLEGGNALVDLPGLNDCVPGALAETRDGIMGAGVVLVLLQKSLDQDATTIDFLSHAGVFRKLLDEELTLVFILNREGLKDYDPAEIDSADEEDIRREAEENTRSSLISSLQAENLRLSQQLSAERIREIAASTRFKAIYPTTYSAWAFNNERDEESQAKAKRAQEASGMLWFLGLVSAVNRDGTVSDLKHIATTVLPDLELKLQRTLAVAHADASIPAELVITANSLLNSKKRKRNADNSFDLAFGELLSNIQALFSTRDGNFHKRLTEQVVDRFVGGPEVSAFLDRAKELQAQKLDELFKDKIKRGSTALRAIQPDHSGMFFRAEVVPVAFGVMPAFFDLDCEPLVRGVKEELQHLQQALVDEVINATKRLTSTRNTSTRNADDGELVASLREIFVHSSLVQRLDARCCQKSFFCAKQNKVHLKNGNAEVFLQKLAAGQMVNAVHDKILLTYRDQARQPALIVQSVREHVERCCHGARKAWVEYFRSAAGGFFEKQLALLRHDLCSDQRRPLIKSVLASFFELIVQMAGLKKDTPTQTELAHYRRELREMSTELYALWTRSLKQSEPAELGRSFVRSLELRQLQQAVLRNVDRQVLAHLQKTMHSRSSININRNDVISFDSENHILAAGRVNHVSSTISALQQTYPLFGLNMPSGKEDLFSVLAVLMWRKTHLKQLGGNAEKNTQSMRMGNGVARVAEQLRCFVASQMLCFYQSSKKRETLERTLGEKLEEYLDRLKQDYCGDLLCLRFIAQYFQAHFLVWRPLTNCISPPILISGLDHRDNPVGPSLQAFCLVAASCTDEEEADDGSTRHPSRHSCAWFPMRDSRYVRFQKDAEQHVFTSTDEDWEARGYFMRDKRTGLEDGYMTSRIRRTHSEAEARQAGAYWERKALEANEK